MTVPKRNFTQKLQNLKNALVDSQVSRIHHLRNTTHRCNFLPTYLVDVEIFIRISEIFDLAAGGARRDYNLTKFHGNSSNIYGIFNKNRKCQPRCVAKG